MEYDPTATYQFTDSDGNVITSLGDNGYIWQAYTEGLPLSINENGDWFVTPYLDTSGGQIVSYIPEWFKSTPDYASWEALEGQLSTATPLQIAAAQDYLKSIGSMGAYKYAQTNYAKQFGITDQKLIDEYAQNVYNIALEGNGDQKANLNGVFGSDQNESVEDVLRSFKNMSKEELSETLTNLYQIVKKGSEGTWTGDQKTLADALTMVSLVEYTKDNLSKYGEEKEFDGLYDASFLQNFRRWFATMSASFTENNVLGIPVRLLNWAVNGTPRIEDQVNEVLGTDPTLGASMEGTTTAEKIGLWSGALVNIAVTLYLMKGAGNFINGHFANSSIGSFLANSGNTITGAVASDFFINDLPLDIVMFINDLGRYEGNVGKALWNPEETQPLTGIPFFTIDEDNWLMPSGFGPQVPGGLVMNAVGDILVDFAPKILQIATTATSSKIDGLTNGGVTRLRETASSKLMGIENKIADNKLVSWWWRGFLNKMMTPEVNNLLQEARKASVASKSTDIYIEMQNALTFNNQKGMSEVGPKFKQIENELGIPKAIKDFINKANDYGGIKDVKAEVHHAVGGQDVADTKTVHDVLPIKVKQGVLDVERLAELKGQVENNGGIIADVKTKEEIATLEERLSNTPQAIKDFADKIAEANKRVEDIRIEAGLTQEQWINHLRENPEFAKYMTRQTVNPEYGGIGGASNPAEARIFGTRRDYYAKNYIDPILALNLKVEAIGKAIAWNNTQKVLSSAEQIQGNITAGGESIQIANHLADLKEEIRTKADYRQRIGWDDSLKTFNNDMNSVSNSFRYINDLQNMPGNASVKAVYNSYVDPNIKNTIRDFSTGKITFADGVKEAVGLSDSAAAQVINNTYRLEGTAKGGAVSDNVPTEDIPLTEAGRYNAGITNDGVPYKYQMMNGKIITMEKITDVNEIADAVASMGGVYRIAPETIKHLGEDFTYGILRGIKYYNEEMIPLPTGANFRVASRDGVYGWIPTPGRSVNQPQYRFRIENGLFVADQYPLYLEANLYKKGNEARLSSYQARDAISGFAPKNSNVPENTAIHENGHNMMARLTILELNSEIKNGILTVPEKVTQEWINQTIYEKWVNLHKLIGTEALKSMGFVPTDAEWVRQAKTISGYAGKGNYENKTYRYETMSEGEVDFYCNKQNASQFSLAVLEQMKKHAERFAMAAEPGIIMAKNELTPPKGMIKDDQYNFPANVKTDKQKAKWLESYRKNNPYVGSKKFDEDTYIKANLWDTFLQKEIRSYNPDSKTVMPDALVKKNSVFLDELSVKSGDLIMNKIREAGVKGFQQEFATIVLSKNSEDISKAIDNFIIARVNEAAQEVAAKLPGGATEDNLNKARATMWSEDAIRNDVVNMVRTLTPDVDTKTIQGSVAELFKRQSEGFAAYDTLPVDIKDKIYDMKQLEAQLARNNAYVKDAGRKADAELPEKGWAKDTTRVVHYKEGGQDVYLLMKDPLIASLYEKPNNFKDTGLTTEGITTFANAVARTYRLGTTAMNPVALVSNVLRDPLQATIQGGFNPLTMNFSPDVFYRSLRQFGLDDATIEKVIQKGVNWTREGTMTAELRRYGTGVGYKNNVERAGQAVNRVFNNEARSKTGQFFGKIIEGGEAPLEMWESYFRNQVYEQSFIKNYKKTKDVNKAMSAAMFDASNSTTNFSHAIGHFQNAISTVSYLSSAINGTRSFWVQFNVDPIGMMGRITAGAMVPTMAVTAWNLSNEERRKTYLNLPEWFRQQHLVFVDMNNNVFALPIPGELEQYYGTARKLIEFTQESSPYALETILLHGAFGFLPADVNGFFGPDGSVNFKEGAWQLASGILPQAATAIYEFRYERNLFTGQDLSDYTTFNKWLNLLGNTMGTGFKEAINSIGLMVGIPEKELVGKGFANTLARNLFGVGFDDATSQFMNLIGEKEHRAESGKMVPATGLFKKNEELRRDIEEISQKIAFAKDETKKKELEEKKQKMIDDFSEEVKNLVNNYMQLYTITGGLEEWQKKKIVSILTLGGGYSSASSDSYVSDEANQASLSEQNLARERYVNAGLPAGPNDFTTSIEAQAALNRFYGAPKQASSDFTHIADEAKLKDIRNEFYDTVDKIYDYAEEHNISPDYDLIEKIQARYLQAVDAVLIPVINEYGIDVLNNSKFIDTVEKYVNGMIPSDDWKQSAKNARKYLSTKEFPTATVNVKKWLIQRYSTGMRNRGLKSDNEVVRMLAEIKADIDTGKSGSAKGKIQTLIDGINRANYYISSDDFQLLTQFKNMVK